MKEPNRFWQENSASDGCNISRAKFCKPSSPPFKADENKKMKFFYRGRGNFEEKSCMYILYAIYNGVSRIQLTVYLGGWKDYPPLFV